MVVMTSKKNRTASVVSKRRRWPGHLMVNDLPESAADSGGIESASSGFFQRKLEFAMEARRQIAWNGRADLRAD